MADIPKLAGTFDALRVTVEVAHNYVGQAIRAYREAGLHPNLADFDEREGVILIRVSVPVDPLQCPIGSVPRQFSLLTDTFHGEIREATKTPLICPVPTPASQAEEFYALYKEVIAQTKRTQDGVPIVIGSTVWSCTKRSGLRAWTVKEIRPDGVVVIINKLEHYIEYADAFSTHEAAKAEMERRASGK